MTLFTFLFKSMLISTTHAHGLPDEDIHITQSTNPYEYLVVIVIGAVIVISLLVLFIFKSKNK